MTTTNELLDLFEQIPAWRRVRELPERIDALERLLVELDARTKGRRAEHCPICNGGTLATVEVQEHPNFGHVGVQEWILHCSDCAHSEKRLHDPLGRLDERQDRAQK